MKGWAHPHLRQQNHLDHCGEMVSSLPETRGVLCLHVSLLQRGPFATRAMRNFKAYMEKVRISSIRNFALAFCLLWT
jgi:hypothetical protein